MRAWAPVPLAQWSVQVWLLELMHQFDVSLIHRWLNAVKFTAVIKLYRVQKKENSSILS